VSEVRFAQQTLLGKKQVEGQSSICVPPPAQIGIPVSNPKFADEDESEAAFVRIGWLRSSCVYRAVKARQKKSFDQRRSDTGASKRSLLHERMLVV